MTIDRERIRADAEERQFVCQCAKDCLTLLAELEQAEKEMTACQEAYVGVVRQKFAAEARLAKVPGLVEAAHAIVSFYRDPDADRSTERMLEVENALISALAEEERLEFFEGPPGRSPRAKCYRTPLAPGAESSGVAQMELDAEHSAAPLPRRGKAQERSSEATPPEAEGVEPSRGGESSG